MKKNAIRLRKMRLRGYDLGVMFQYFLLHEWIFETKVIFQTMAVMSKEELEIFKFNPKNIKWKYANELYVYGMQKFLLN